MQKTIRVESVVGPGPTRKSVESAERARSGRLVRRRCWQSRMKCFSTSLSYGRHALARLGDAYRKII
jgi:hypothetical protein